MLYDNAQPARVVLHAWQVTGSEFFSTIDEETLDRSMAAPRSMFTPTSLAKRPSPNRKHSRSCWNSADTLPGSRLTLLLRIR